MCEIFNHNLFAAVESFLRDDTVRTLVFSIPRHMFTTSTLLSMLVCDNAYTPENVAYCYRSTTRGVMSVVGKLCGYASQAAIDYDSYPRGPVALFRSSDRPPEAKYVMRIVDVLQWMNPISPFEPIGEQARAEQRYKQYGLAIYDKAYDIDSLSSIPALRRHYSDTAIPLQIAQAKALVLVSPELVDVLRLDAPYEQLVHITRESCEAMVHYRRTPAMHDNDVLTANPAAAISRMMESIMNEKFDPAPII
jgi:hypothetical protein